MSVLGAGVKGKSSIEIICEGPDEQILMDEIKELFASGFGEKKNKPLYFRENLYP